MVLIQPPQKRSIDEVHKAEKDSRPQTPAPKKSAKKKKT